MKTLKHSIIHCLLFLAGMTSAYALAGEVTTAPANQPADLVKKVFGDFSEAAMRDETLYSENSQKLQELADTILSPYFNFPRMTQIAMARYWSKADKNQRTALIREFKLQLLRSYSKTLFSYRKSSPEITDTQILSDKRQIIKLRINSDKGELIQLFIRFEKHGDNWQVVDVNVEGVSIVVVARGQFSETIAKSGIDGLIESLQQENQQNENRQATP